MRESAGCDDEVDHRTDAVELAKLLVQALDASLDLVALLGEVLKVIPAHSGK